MPTRTSPAPLPTYLAQVAHREGTTPTVTRAGLRRVLAGVRRSLGCRGYPRTRAALGEATRDLRAGRVSWDTATAVACAAAGLGAAGHPGPGRAVLDQCAAALQSYVLAGRGLASTYPRGFYALAD